MFLMHLSVEVTKLEAITEKSLQMVVTSSEKCKAVWVST